MKVTAGSGTGLVESPLRCKAHGGFGERPGETGWRQRQHRAPGRLNREHALTAVAAFARTYAAKFPKAAKKITDDTDEPLAFYDVPAEHWIHLRTANPIESTFATVRLRTKVTRGVGSVAAALAMVFKLVESAQQRWRAMNAPHLVALVRAEARFERGVLVEGTETLAV
jgi:hypothetical protein